jgi:spore germination protein
MIIHVVQDGDTISSIANQYNVSVDRLIIENGIESPNNLVIGQTIVIVLPLITYTVQERDSLFSIAQKNNVSYMHLIRNNPYLINRDYIYPGETIVIEYDTTKTQKIITNGYAYPFISKEVLMQTLPYLTYLTVFNYKINAEGKLNNIDDQEIIDMAKTFGVAPIMMVSAFSEVGIGDSQIATLVTKDEDFQDTLIDTIVTTAKTKGYFGVNHTLYFLNPLNQPLMEKYVRKLSLRLQSEGLFLAITISPKSSIDRTEVNYVTIDYSTLATYANVLVLLSYDWGFSMGPPASATPINGIEAILDQIEHMIPNEKTSLGYSIIGYDWKLPYVPGESRANAMTYNSVIQLAYKSGVDIQFNQTAQAPYFFYNTDEDLHNVWFKDARSVDVLNKLLPKYNLKRVSIWNIMDFFSQLWLILNNTFEFQKVYDP